MKTLILLTIIILIFVIININILLKSSVEGFISHQSTIDNQLQIRFCPDNSNLVQTSKGYTDCCSGDLVNGKCNGTTFCTLSPEHDNIESCSSYWTTYFIKKGQEVCPKTIPYYFRQTGNNNSILLEGCSESKPTEDGTKPEDPWQKKCIIYNNDSDNKLKANSCYIKKKKDTMKCPVISGELGIAGTYAEGDNLMYFFCQYTGKNGLPPSECIEDISYKNYLSRVLPNWITLSSAKRIENSFCSKYLKNIQDETDVNKQLEEERQKALQAEKAKNDALTLADKYKKQWEEAMKKFKFNKMW